MSFTSGAYRIVKINCPVDVKVYNEEGKLVAAIESDTPVDVGSSIISGVNNDGEKFICLPAYVNYKVEMKATADGTLTYSINEFSFKRGDVSRITIFKDISILQGDLLVGHIPSISQDELEDSIPNGSSVEYQLIGSDNQPIAADVNIKGDAVEAAYYMVKVIADVPTRGYVIGSGIRRYGSYAQLVAMPVKGCRFDGWYINDVLYSKEETARIRVEKDLNVVAKFLGNSYKFTLKSTEGGTIEPVNRNTLDAGEIIKLKAIPEPGFVFSGWTSSAGGIFDDEKNQEASFLMTSNDVIVTANFKEDTSQIYHLEVKSTTGGEIVIGSSGDCRAGEVVEIQASANEGYEFKGWTSSNGGVFSSPNSLTTTFKMPTNDTTVTASFTKVNALWKPNTLYKVAETVEYNGKQYKCIQSHTSLLGWEPDKVFALWEKVKAEGIGEWEEQVHYNVGDIVTYKGQKYKCRISHTAISTWTPAQTPTLWVKQ